MFFFFGALRLNRALQVGSAFVGCLVFMLAAGDVTGNKSFSVFDGYEGIFCGFSAIYTGLGQVLHEVYGKVVWPVGPVKKKINK